MGSVDLEKSGHFLSYLLFHAPHNLNRSSDNTSAVHRKS